MAEYLFEKLKKYSESGIYPFCMPGHKRAFSPPCCENPYAVDITEVPGFDDLQKCEGLLGDIQKEMADAYKCEYAFISVNGSSACNLAAVIALEDSAGVLAASNCHRSVFNAIKINKRHAVFIDPAYLPEGVCGGINADEANALLKKNRDVRALIVTSPTYEGFVSDISALADAAHENGALLIVDEAHGAHLPFAKKAGFPESALYRGADIVIQSLHKTLPSLNQTSVILVPHGTLLAARVKESLNMVMTTSPSYILIASAQAAVRRAASRPESFAAYAENLKKLRENLKSLKNISLVDNSAAGNYNISAVDPGKLLFLTHPEKTALTGEKLLDVLLEKYELQLEKAGEGFALAMTSVMDTKEGFERLENALAEIDSEL